MGTRETQLIGLNEKTLKFLKDNEYKRSKDPYAEASASGMFDDGPELYEWTKPGDDEGLETLREMVQCAPWSSGPCIFLCLEGFYGIRVGQWSVEEIDGILG